MAKKRGNPNWGKPDMQVAPIVPTSFEEVVKKLRLSSAEYEGSLPVALRMVVAHSGGAGDGAPQYR